MPEGTFPLVFNLSKLLICGLCSAATKSELTNDTLESQSVIPLHVDSGRSTLLNGPLHPSRRVAHVRIPTATADRSADFENWLRNEMIPGQASGLLEALESVRFGSKVVSELALGH